MNNLVKVCFGVFISFIMLGLMTSCSDSDELISVEDYVGEAVFSLESQGKIGRRGCYEFIFPISVNFPGGGIVIADDYRTLRGAIKAWKETNPESDVRPTLAFPLDVTSQDGEVITVDNKEELGDLRRACRRAHHDRRWRPGHGFRNACFKPVFPLTVIFPNGSELEAATPETLKSALRAWKKTVGRTDEHPMLKFPITVEYEDESQVEVASKEDLKELKDECDTDG